MQHNSTIIDINLDLNEIEYKGSTYISNMLKTNKSLKIIHMMYTHIMSDGIEIISEGLASNTTVTTIYFGCNHIGKGNGMLHLSKMLAINASIESICLGSNYIDDEGIKHLSCALKTNKTLKFVLNSFIRLIWQAT